MTDKTEAPTPLPPCPMCGEEKGYDLTEGLTYRWWNVSCAACGRAIGECASDRPMRFGGIAPDRCKDADEVWNAAAAYAESLRAALAQRQQVPEEDAMPCGHHPSLLLKSAETGEPLYCELCDAQSGREDAERRESELAQANAALRAKIAALTAAPSAQEPDQGEGR